MVSERAALTPSRTSALPDRGVPVTVDAGLLAAFDIVPIDADDYT